jgi:hypothetical protein
VGAVSRLIDPEAADYDDDYDGRMTALGALGAGAALVEVVREAVGESEGMASGSDALAPLVATACDALGWLVRDHNEDEPTANQTTTVAAGGIEVVVAALKAHLGAEAVQNYGCWALKCLVFSGDRAHVVPANQTAAVAAGGIEVVVAALHAHPDSESVQLHGCLALDNLLFDCPANHTAAVAAGGIEAVVAGLRAHPGSWEMQGDCYQSLIMLVGLQRSDNHLKWCDPQANQTKAVAAGIIEAVVAGLQARTGSRQGPGEAFDMLIDMLAQWNTHAKGQPQGCLRTTVANQTAVAAAGGIQAVVAALRTHGGEAARHDNDYINGCDLLSMLVADHLANQTAAAAGGGIEAVVVGLRKWRGREGVEESGCLALGNLVINHAANTAVAVRAGAIQLAEAACARFAAESATHKETSRLLRVLRDSRRVSFGADNHVQEYIVPPQEVADKQGAAAKYKA